MSKKLLKKVKQFLISEIRIVSPNQKIVDKVENNTNNNFFVKIGSIVEYAEKGFEKQFMLVITYNPDIGLSLIELDTGNCYCEAFKPDFSNLKESEEIFDYTIYLSELVGDFGNQVAWKLIRY